MNPRTSCVIGVPILLLAVSALAAKPNSGGCRSINALAVTVDFQQPCLADPAFSFCFISSIRGALKGTWNSFFQDEWVVDLSELGLPIPSGSPGSFWNRSFEVIKTEKGTLYGDAQLVFDIRQFEAGGLAIPIVVTGGDGIYEDATGWLVAIDESGGNERFRVRGRVCGPEIEGDN